MPACSNLNGPYQTSRALASLTGPSQISPTLKSLVVPLVPHSSELTDSLTTFPGPSRLCSALHDPDRALTVVKTQPTYGRRAGPSASNQYSRLPAAPRERRWAAERAGAGGGLRHELAARRRVGLAPAAFGRAVGRHTP